MVPRECSTGNKKKLRGIRKRAISAYKDSSFRMPIGVVQQGHKRTPRLSDLCMQLLGQTRQNVVVVVLANELIRLAWAVLSKNERYRTPVFAVTT
jgi:transposase